MKDNIIRIGVSAGVGLVVGLYAVWSYNRGYNRGYKMGQLMYQVDKGLKDLESTFSKYNKGKEE